MLLEPWCTAHAQSPLVSTNWAWNVFFGRFLLRLSRIKCPQVMLVVIFLLVHFFGTPCIHNNNAIFNKVMQKFPYQHDVVEYGQASPQGRVDFSQLVGLLQLLVLFAQNKYTHPVC